MILFFFGLCGDFEFPDCVQPEILQFLCQIYQIIKEIDDYAAYSSIHP